MEHFNKQNFEFILQFVSIEFQNVDKPTHLNMAFILEPYSDNLFKIIATDKALAKKVISHDFNGLFHHYGLKKADDNFLPILELNIQAKDIQLQSI
jgi:hypothetical protein